MTQNIHVIFHTVQQASYLFMLWKFDYEVAFSPVSTRALFTGARSTSVQLIPSASSKLTAKTYKVSEVHGVGRNRQWTPPIFDLRRHDFTDNNRSCGGRTAARCVHTGGRAGMNES